MRSILSFVVVLGILILVHELGHFLLAKLLRIRVLAFSLGFGPRLVGFKRGGTEYLLSAFPLGGYVRMLGEDPMEDVQDHDRAGAFSLRPIWQRFCVVAAGPLFNLIFAVVLFSGLYWLAGIPIPRDTTTIGNVDTASPAAKAGIISGDLIVAIDDQPVTEWGQVSAGIGRQTAASVPLPLKVTIRRGGNIMDFVVSPQMREVKNIFGEVVDRRPMIGIARAEVVDYRPASIVQALRAGMLQTWNFVVLTILGIVKIIQKVVPASDLGGPILIAQVAGQQLQTGWLHFISFMALVSVNLAVLNLLPIPVLDGGHLFFYALEAVMRRPLSMRAREMWQQVGLVLLGSLMVFVFYNDLVRVFGG